MTVFAPSIVTVQRRFEPRHAPLQRTNRAFAAGVAVRTSRRPDVTRCTQILGRLVVAQVPTAERTLPRPMTRIVSTRVTGALLKVAVTDWPAVIVTVHVRAVPRHAPPQPVN
ncbi:MAG: hypothetical protein M3321_05935, partial [Actinomycetota bacterium]|nr:hypothetical protein [Actinomycetota bacterium]